MAETGSSNVGKNVSEPPSMYSTPQKQDSGMYIKWLKGLRIAHIGHSKSASLFAFRGRVLGLCTVVLATVVGSSIFATMASSPATWQKVIVGGMSLVAAALAAAQTFLNYPEVAEQHRRASQQFGVLRRELEIELDGGVPDHERVQSVISRWNQLEGEVPAVPDRFHKMALARVKDI
jgi:hypothetical protein